MRRLAFAAVLGGLVLTACSDLSKETPTEPDGVSQPSFTVLTSQPCATTAWRDTQLALAKTIFPGGKGQTLLSSANEKLTDIYNLCRKNQQTAITKAIFFDDWMFKKFQSKLLTTKPTLSTDVLTLFVNVLSGVGLNTSTISPDLVTSDAGTGVFACEPTCPTTPTTVFTTLSLAALQVPGQGFSETTLLLIDKLPNDTKLKVPAGQGRSQFPPFYEFNAINARNQHVLNTGKYAHVEMCLYQDIAYPPGFAIGHNPVFGAPGYPFEVLPSDNIFLLACEFDGSKISLGNHGSLPGLAVSAWHTTKQALTAIFLPQTLRAATMALRTGSAAGKTSSLSPFGIVGPGTLEFTPSGNPGGQTFFENSTLTWDCTKDCTSVFPAVRLVDAEGTGIGDVEITVTLIPVNGSAGTFTTGKEGGSTTTVLTSSGERAAGFAEFNKLSITEAGTYMLRFSAPDKVPSLTSTVFTVEASIPATFGSAGWSYKEITNFDKVPGEWLTITPTAADGWATGTAPFGTPGCDLTTPATAWTQNTTMLLRRDIFIPANTASITIDILIDNDVFAFVNGWGVDHGGFFGSGCAPVQFSVKASTTALATADAPLLPGQVNKIFIRGVDTDEKTPPYLDAKITLNQVRSTAP